VVEVQLAHVREHHYPETGAERPRQQEVILFRSEEPCLVHVIGLGEGALFDRIEPASQALPEHVVDSEQKSQEAFLQKRQEEHLIHQHVAELRVLCHQPMQIGGPASGVSDTERRLAHLRSTQRREQDRIRREAHRMDRGDHRHAD
jgi:hypothetical protein